MGRIEEINKRLLEIKADIEKRGGEMSADDIKALETESAQLLEERAKLLDSAEKRAALLNRIAEGTEPGAAVVRSFPVPAPESKEQRGAEIDKYDTPEYRKAFMNYVLRGSQLPAEYRADAVTTTTDAGATIPTTVLNKIVEKMEAVGMILPLVTQTAYKGGVSIPTSTAKPVATWVNEGAGSEKQKKAVPKDGMITFTYHKLRCAVAVSLEVDTMALSAFESTLINNVTEAMTKAVEQAIISGTGSGQPKGITKETAPADQKIEVAAPAYNDLIQAEAALPQAYESGAVWCMSKKTFMQYYGLTDSNGNPIGREVRGATIGMPERYLLGRPVVCCDYVPSFASSLAAGTVFAFMFRFKDYILNSNYAMTVKKYEDNDTDDIVTKAIMLVDGKTVDKNSLVVLAKKAGS